MSYYKEKARAAETAIKMAKVSEFMDTVLTSIPTLTTKNEPIELDDLYNEYVRVQYNLPDHQIVILVDPIQHQMLYQKLQHSDIVKQLIAGYNVNYLGFVTFIAIPKGIVVKDILDMANVSDRNIVYVNKFIDKRSPTNDPIDVIV